MSEYDHEDINEKFSAYYMFIEEIDKGAFGTVVRALDFSSQKEIAVKILQKKNLKPSHIAHLHQEAEIMSSLEHKNIIKYIHIRETQTRVFLGMELFKGSNLKKYIESQNISETKARLIVKEILEGIEYLHSKRIIHRDLKPENILIAESSELSVKICDFGLSSQLGKKMMESGKCGSLIFMAPEQQFHKYYSYAVDVWSCGIILYMLICRGKHPLANKNEDRNSYIKKLKHPVFKDRLPQKVKSLFDKMVMKDPLERYSAMQCLKHPWVSKKNTKLPLTMMEEYVQYSDFLKLKSLLFPIIFTQLINPKKESSREIIQQRNKATPVVRDRIRSPGYTRRIGSVQRKRIFSVEKMPLRRHRQTKKVVNLRFENKN